MTEHTPTPWASSDQYLQDENGHPLPIATGHYTYVTDRSGRLHEQAVANAAFIVKAVNSHDELVKALEKVRSYNVEIAAGRINYRPHDHIQIIDEALALVGSPK